MISPEPFLRWAGGKRQLLPVIHAALPKDFDLSANRFFEPFVGGGAVMFSLHDFFGGQASRRNRIIINDVNEELVCTYRALRDSNHDVLRGLSKLKSKISEDDYYKMRSRRPKSDVDRAVRLIYLNRTGFNGLYRVNSSGFFNVPWGKLKNPTVCNDELLIAVGEWLKNVTIRNGSYTSALEDAKMGDVVYLDPPYIPLSQTSSFSRYAKDDFLEIAQYALAGVIRGLTERGVRVVFSNSYTPTTLDIFGEVLDLRVINATRSISAKSSSRGVVQEVIGVNFDLSECCDPTAMRSLNQG
jgi:DNA adenine methylase